MPTPTPTRPHWWQWPTVLSLDAPCVVLAWQWLFATVAGVPLRPAHVGIVGASVWLAYAADRWFEAWRLTPDLIQTARHRFYRDHQKTVALLWVAVLVADVTVALTELTTRELFGGFLLLVPTLLYLLSHQLLHRNHPWRAPKEFLIAVLLAGGASVFVLAAPGAPIRTLLPCLVLFAAICLANVALIAAWEREVDEAHGQTSIVRQFRRATTASRLLPPTLALAALGATVWPGIPAIVAGSAATTALLLAMIDRCEPRIGWRVARVLADAAVLTPLIPLLARLARSRLP